MHVCRSSARWVLTEPFGWHLCLTLTVDDRMAFSRSQRRVVKRVARCELLPSRSEPMARPRLYDESTNANARRPYEAWFPRSGSFFKTGAVFIGSEALLRQICTHARCCCVFSQYVYATYSAFSLEWFAARRFSDQLAVDPR